LTTEQQGDEAVLLGLRLASGLVIDALSSSGQERVTEAVTEGLLDPHAFDAGRAVLTLRGRLLADRLAVELLTN
jgi:oxygen-independent coproporphyrinogen-3 oxidase